MLHVRIFPVRLQSAHTECGCRSACGYSHAAWYWLIEARRGGDCSGATRYCTNTKCFLIGGIQTDVLLPSPVQDLIVIDAVAGANGSRAFAEWIPGDAKARSKVTFGRLG